MVKHENFEFIEGVPSYDIALLFIEQPFQENGFVGGIPLPKDGQETKGKGCWVLAIFYESEC